VRPVFFHIPENALQEGTKVNALGIAKDVESPQLPPVRPCRAVERARRSSSACFHSSSL
jgi:hypothetical protein